MLRDHQQNRKGDVSRQLRLSQVLLLLSQPKRGTMTTTKQKIAALTTEFADNILKVIQEHLSLDGIVGSETTPRRAVNRAAAAKEKPAKAAKAASPRAKHARRTPEEFEALSVKILSFLEKNPGSRMEAISGGLKSETKELAPVIKKLLDGKKIGRKGMKRATEYTLRAAGAKANGKAAAATKKTETEDAAEA